MFLMIGHPNAAWVHGLVVPMPDVFVLIGNPFKWPKMCKRQQDGSWIMYEYDEETGDWRMWDRVTDESMRHVVAKSHGIWVKA